MNRALIISENHYLTSSPILFATRVVGLAPFSVTKNPKGGQYILQYSLSYTVYSYAFCFLIVFLSTMGMIADLHVKPSSKSIRMKDVTSKIVTGSDIIFIMFSAAVCVFGAPFRVEKIKKMISILHEVDQVLQLSDTKTARKRSIKTVTIVNVMVFIILSLDLASWNIRVTRWSNNAALFQCYFAFYFLYFIIIGLELQYWHAAYCLTRRFRRLNECLNVDNLTDQNPFLKTLNVNFEKLSSKHVKNHGLKNPSNKKSKKFDQFFSNSKPTHLESDPLGKIKPKYLGNVIDVLGMNYSKPEDEKLFRNTNSEFDAEYVKQLRKVQYQLCECVFIINEIYGFPILVMIMSCMLHLVVTPYFFLTELLNPRSERAMFTAVQFMWVLAHSARLLVIVLPCYTTVFESKNTGPLVCKLLNENIDNDLKKQLKLFSLQVLHRSVEFSAYGLITLNRELLTTIAGSITTYVVILMQFEKNS